MNLLHHWICRSGYWKRTIETEVLPWALEGLDLGPDVLEIGPGYGIATSILSMRVTRLTCVEIDGSLADALSRRIARTNVAVIHADALHMPLPDESFSAALCFTMLHHIPTSAEQDRLLAEVARVLRPSAMFAGTDSVAGLLFRMIHVGDMMTPVDPKMLPQRLRSAGFNGIGVEQRGRVFRFRASRCCKPLLPAMRVVLS